MKRFEAYGLNASTLHMAAGIRTHTHLQEAQNAAYGWLCAEGTAADVPPLWLQRQAALFVIGSRKGNDPETDRLIAGWFKRTVSAMESEPNGWHSTYAAIPVALERVREFQALIEDEATTPDQRAELQAEGYAAGVTLSVHVARLVEMIEGMRL